MVFLEAVMRELLYRFTAGGAGIYGAVERACPRTDPRRAVKPDGAWLERVGERYPGSVSYFTATGVARYRSSGLLEWHRSVIDSAVLVETARMRGTPLYADEDQILCSPEDIEPIETVSLNKFLECSSYDVGR